MLSILKASDIITIYGKEIYEHIKSDIGEFKNITKEALSKYIPENVNVKKEITSDLSDISDKIRNSINEADAILNKIKEISIDNELPFSIVPQNTVVRILRRYNLVLSEIMLTQLIEHSKKYFNKGFLTEDSINSYLEKIGATIISKKERELMELEEAQQLKRNEVLEELSKKVNIDIDELMHKFDAAITLGIKLGSLKYGVKAYTYLFVHPDYPVLFKDRVLQKLEADTLRKKLTAERKNKNISRKSR
jgi:hypothetical protein